MGKTKKIRSSHGDTVQSGQSLGNQILADKEARPKRNKLIEKSKKPSSAAATGPNSNSFHDLQSSKFVGDSMSQKILEEALKQQRELQNEQNTSTKDYDDTAWKKKLWHACLQIFVRKMRAWNSNREKAVNYEKLCEFRYDLLRRIEQSSWSLGGEAGPSQQDAHSEDDEDPKRSPLDEEEEYMDEPIEIDEEEEEAVERFMASDPGTRQTLGGLIRGKITDKESEVATHFSDASLALRELDPRLEEMYKGVREVLRTYRSGKLPKAFKIIPNLVNWEQILSLTEPEQWTAAAMYQATRIFVSNLNAKLCQRFLNLVLLPRIRDDIAEYKKLNFHLYQSGTCTLREATIVSSVLTKCSVPVLHAAAAMLKLAEMDYTGANSLFLRTLIDKKYTMPFRVIDALVAHFLRFERDKRDMPVLWHQALLSLVQRYKTDMSSEQRESLLELLKVHAHYMITPEVRREIHSAVSRDAEDGSTLREDMMD